MGRGYRPFPGRAGNHQPVSQNLSDYANFPRIIVSDFFDVKPGDTFDFPPPKADLSSGFTKVKDPMPEFDAAVGNFPFIRRNSSKRLFLITRKSWKT